MTPEKKKKIVVAVSCITAAALIAGAITFYLATRPVTPPDPQDRKAASDFLASDAFSKLPPEKQSDFVRRMRPAKRPTRAEMQNMRKEFEAMPPEKRQKMMQNMRRVIMQEQEARLDRFFKMSKAEQLAELDRRIAEQNKRRENMRKRRQQQQAQNAQPGDKKDANPAPQGHPRRRPSAQMRRDFESSISPAARAKWQQYRKMERMRREGKLK